MAAGSVDRFFSNESGYVHHIHFVPLLGWLSLTIRANVIFVPEMALLDHAAYRAWPFWVVRYGTDLG